MSPQENLKVEMTDFQEALQEVKPAFGVESDALERHKLQGIIPHGPNFDHLVKTCKTLISQTKTSSTTPMVTMLLEGASGCGKTAVAASLALESDAPFIKLISAENMVGFSESSKISYMVKVFDDAYKVSSARPLICFAPSLSLRV